MGVLASGITLEELAELPEGVQHEVDAGELISVPLNKSLHSRIARRVARLIEKAIADGQMDVYVEAGYLLCSDPLTLRQPDVSVLSRARVATTKPDAYFEGAPELAVEVISPNDTAEGIERKVRQYLQYGSQQVWVLYPKTRDLHVFYADGSATVLTESEILPGEPLLPGVSHPVSQLFEI